MRNKILIGSWGKPDSLRGYPLGHPRDTRISIERHREMLYKLYIPNGINFIVFDPYFIALDKIPTYKGLEELNLYRSELLKFSEELDELGVIRYGHNSHYCHFLSENADTRKRSLHEIEYLLELSEVLNLVGVGIHLSGNSNSTNIVKEAVKILSTFPEKRLKKIYIENLPTKVGSIFNVLEIANELPVQIAFDVGHFMIYDSKKLNIYNCIEKIIKYTKPKALFIHLSKEVKRVHKNLDIEWSIDFIRTLDRNFDVDLHIDIESPDRINDCIKLKNILKL